MARAIQTTTIKPTVVKKVDTRFAHIQPAGSWEIPRKLYHYSIGFLVLCLFIYDYDTLVIYPPLTAFLCLVLTGEMLRFQFEWFNVLYCKVLGPLMRQSEISTRFNGVVYYLAGCIIVLYVFPRDIAALSIIYLSWTDPTASICGRLWGKYTPRCGNKSLAGSLGAWFTGSLVTYLFFGTWQYASPVGSIFPTSYDLHLSQVPLWLFSLYGGFVSAFSEFIGDSLGLDDNLTIPVVSAALLWFALVVLDWGQ
ncbi:phosphatidate cytidylyltransferase [Halteromyces radiatus]|uniref:phosphatidate cytidylyltransferase n=1 Tax=Halteromyces radiatus TaxID=101107 RepID=UPI002220487D|nr:phosphatidate cytidylyltransferase [Halteromyces radiatus]KAI8096205.1 phosphatidate cytidylyltransferase [Halteromyces radiatus]